MFSPDPHRAAVLRKADDAQGYLARICFKTGPPTLTGVELEWIVHDRSDPTRPVTAERLRAALGPYAPGTLDPTSPQLPLPRLASVTVEPGGQVELSSAPQPGLGPLLGSTNADIEHLTGLLARTGLILGTGGIDAYRPPHPVVRTARYRAMCAAFDRRGMAGRTMMYSTAGLQVCLDAGEPGQLAERWQAVHALGPPLLAIFATAGCFAGRDTGWASARMAAWQHIDPAWTRPVWSPAATADDPVAAWSAYVLGAPLLCLRRPGPDWSAPPGVRFQDWIDGALPRPPTTDDLDYHLSTLFPPVRPRGYLEVRYLDSQPGADWIAPVAVLAAVLADRRTLDLARQACEPVADRWWAAARYGLADPALARAARQLSDMALRALDRTDLPASARSRVTRVVCRRLTAGERSRR